MLIRALWCSKPLWVLQCHCFYAPWHIKTDLGKELSSSSFLGSILNPHLDFEGLLDKRCSSH